MPEIDLTSSDLSHAVLAHHNLTGHNFIGVSFAGADLTDAVLRNCDLTGANFAGANLSRADLRGSKLVDAVMREAILVDASFVGCDMAGADTVILGQDDEGVQFWCYRNQQGRTVITDGTERQVGARDVVIQYRALLAKSSLTPAQRSLAASRISIAERACLVAEVRGWRN